MKYARNKNEKHFSKGKGIFLADEKSMLIAIAKHFREFGVQTKLLTRFSNWTAKCCINVNVITNVSKEV